MFFISQLSLTWSALIGGELNMVTRFLTGHSSFEYLLKKNKIAVNEQRMFCSLESETVDPESTVQFAGSAKLCK